MAEYIDRQKLLKALSYEGTCRSKNSESPDLLRGLVIAILVAKKEVETADVAPVVHAKWEMRRVYVNGYEGSGEEKAFCSHCNKSNKQYTPPYCPHCGAKMDEEDENGRG